eukprot:CAMPEP_0202833664 /NCGR_PEP_ID=MMETSP1389-20130828/27409_1 /ASSEMBLY_ACC=CAM_ASM_000865 /TAXON_ID=302021 /ORGANISM="Rhodomonas sp., Strain CCMP768" /LENGTH=46 /DNA_ID= /DNA_START= /DNA_END= /DNA_ORIENTATION=
MAGGGGADSTRGSSVPLASLSPPLRRRSSSLDCRRDTITAATATAP